jgi:NhaA family Na+:H+ antiporter
LVAALVWASVGSYESFWHDGSVLGANRREVAEWLMASFFFLVGLEIKRELVVGGLRDRRAATLPVLAALGGIAVPAIVFGVVAGNTTGVDGWTLPLATDIALALGVLALLGDRVPRGVRLLLLGLAVADDIGTVLVVAVLYGGGVSASVVGVAVAMIVPVRPVRGVPVLERTEHYLLPWVSFAVVPLFVLASAGVALDGDAVTSALGSTVALAVVGALVIGKVIGVSGAAFLAVRLRVGSLPADVTWLHVVGVGCLAGISLTVSLFVAGVVFTGGALSDAKIGLVVGSLLSAVLGAACFGLAGRRERP